MKTIYARHKNRGTSFAVSRQIIIHRSGFLQTKNVSMDLMIIIHDRVVVVVVVVMMMMMMMMMMMINHTID